MATKPKPKVRYSGVLATPMTWYGGLAAALPQDAGVPPTPGAPGSRPGLSAFAPAVLGNQRRDDADNNLRQFLARIAALFEHYRVPIGDFRTLAVRLAIEHVPGFRWRRPGTRERGRPPGLSTDVDVVDRAQQFLEILRLRPKYGLKRACQIASRRRGSYCHGVNPETLRKLVAKAERAPTRPDDPASRAHMALVVARIWIDREKEAERARAAAETTSPPPVGRK